MLMLTLESVWKTECGGFMEAAALPTSIPPLGMSSSSESSSDGSGSDSPFSSASASAAALSSQPEKKERASSDDDSMPGLVSCSSSSESHRAIPTDGRPPRAFHDATHLRQSACNQYVISV